LASPIIFSSVLSLFSIVQLDLGGKTFSGSAVVVLFFWPLVGPPFCVLAWTWPWPRLSLGFAFLSVVSCPLDWSVVCVLFSLVIGCLAGPLCGVLSSLGVLVFAGLFALLWWSPSHLRIAKPPKGSFLFPVFEQVSPFFSTALVALEKKPWHSSVFGGEVAGGWKNQTNWNSSLF
jgi:hypothetical protein